MFVPSCISRVYSQQELESVSRFLKLIAEPNRLLILCLLQQGEFSVNQIQQILNLPLNLLSFHLQKLKAGGLISSRKAGLNNFYSLNQQIINENLVFIEQCLTGF